MAASRVSAAAATPAVSAVAPPDPTPDPHLADTGPTWRRDETLPLRRPARLLPGLLLLAGLTVSACGSSPVDAEAPKETIPLKEAETDRREVMQSAQQRFNACLDEAGYEFRGFVGDEGDAVVIEDRSYQEALQRCSGESGVTALRAEFAESRTSRTPDQIRQDNESILAVVACLRAGGMDLDDPVQDETGGLNLRSTLRSADVDPRGNEEARDCISEMWLRRQQQDG